MKTFNHVTGLPELKQLETDESTGVRYYIAPDGSRLPSVTTVLGHFKKKSLVEWRKRVGEEEANKVSTRASIRGTKFHNMMEKYLRNDNTLFENVMPDMKQAFNDMRMLVDNIDNIHYIESPLWSSTLGIAGRTDVIAEYNGVLSIIDFKTSLRAKREEDIQNYFQQGTAYALMYEERVGQPIEQIVIMMSVDNYGTQLFIKNKNDYVNELKNLIRLYKEENNVS